MALAFKLWWCPWGIRLGQRLPFGISYALMMVLLINSTELTALLWPSFHRLRCSFGNDCDKCDSPYRGRCWLKDCMRWLSFGTIGTRWSGGNPPCKVTTLVLYIWITLICWLVWLSLSFVSLFTMRVSLATSACWLVGQDSSSFFDLLFLDKSSLALLFLTGRLVGTSVCFAWLSNLTTVVLLLAAEGGEGLFHFEFLW